MRPNSVRATPLSKGLGHPIRLWPVVDYSAYYYNPHREEYTIKT
jgi:hypothetical protein